MITIFIYALLMSELLKRYFRPFKRPLGRFVSFFLRYYLLFASHLLGVARKSGFNTGSYWHKEFQNPFQTYAPQPFNLQDFFLLLETREDLQTLANKESSEIISSIIIPVFNKAEYTFQCLRALMNEIDFTRHEIIIINNASTDETSRLLSLFTNKIRVINNAQNEGFVIACNQGAKIARGRFLVFLNNDTLVQSRWLDYMLATIESDETIGAVGSMLLYPNGRVQEAGGIIWRDGNAFLYGHSGHPDDYRFNYMREADYCSGASLLVRRNLFESIGGFDERFVPAYYEDTDLCMSVRAAGFKVIYQPLSKVVHYEGITAGVNPQSGFKRFQSINRKKFYEKWRETLEREHLEASQNKIDLAANRKGGVRILVCDESIPITDRDAGSVRMFEIVKTLSKHFRVSFCPLNVLEEPGHIKNLQQLGVRIIYDTDLKSLLRKEKFEIAILSRPNVANAFINLIRRHSPQTKIIYDTVDVYFVRFKREFELTKNPESKKKAEEHKRLESRLANESDQVWCITGNDKDFLLTVSPKANIRIIPNIHAMQDNGSSFSQRKDLLFVGSFGHRPNIDAMCYYKEEIQPFIKKLLPNVKLYVVGSNPVESIRDLDSEETKVLGFVENLEPLLNSCRVFVCPLRYGAGMKGKIGQSLSHGLPVVTTSIGAEGIGLKNKQEALIEDDPEKFAALVAQIYKDENLWNNLSTNGKYFIETNFSPEATEEKLLSALKEFSIEIKAVSKQSI